ncbi:MAG: hypothetical protein MI757_10215, partial [Pirellulales bacterium]|nr:hypothetical protein [Pirellulales bacterium]
MSTGSSQKRTRSERVASVELPPGFTGRMLHHIQRPDVLGRLGLCLLAAVVMLVVTRAWVPPFPYRPGFVPPRDIVPAVAVRKVNDARTEELRRQARAQATFVYDQNRKPLENLRKALHAKLVAVAKAKDYERIEKDWLAFVTQVEIDAAEKQRAIDQKAYDAAVEAAKKKYEAEKAKWEKEQEAKKKA